jgi:hypothetical protein
MVEGVGCHLVPSWVLAVISLWMRQYRDNVVNDEVWRQTPKREDSRQSNVSTGRSAIRESNSGSPLDVASQA